MSNWRHENNAFSAGSRVPASAGAAKREDRALRMARRRMSVVVSLPSAVLVFLLIAWGWKVLGARRRSSERIDPADPSE